MSDKICNLKPKYISSLVSEDTRIESQTNLKSKTKKSIE